VPPRIPHLIRTKVTIASFAEHMTLFRFRDGTQITRMYDCLKTDLADDNGDVRITDGNRTHLFTLEEIQLFSLHRFTHGTSMVLSKLSFLSHRNQCIPLVGCILTNAYVCLNGTQTASTYDMMPPSLEQWFDTLPNN